MDSENFMYRRRRLIRGFDKFLNRVEPFISSRLEEKDSKRLFQDARQEYEALVPRIPFIGKNNPLLVLFLPTPQYLAVYRVLRKLEYPTADAGYLVFEIGSEVIRAIPSIARRIIGTLWFSTWFKDRLIKRAADTQLRRYPGNFVLDYVEGDGREFDYGVDYIECASCKFLEAENAFELAPYVCAIDKPASELLGWGLSRTMTLAGGAHRCDFRFKRGDKTHVVLPQSL